MNFEQIMTADAEKLSAEELQSSLDELNSTVEAVKARSRVITAEQNVRLAKARISEVLAAVPKDIRDQVIKAASVPSGEAVGTPGV